MFVGIARTTRFALNNFRRNLWLSFVTVFLLILTTFSITLVAGLNVVGQQIINTVQDKVDIDLFFHTYTNESDVLEAQAFFKSMKEVDEVIYVSQADAMERFRSIHVDDPVLIASLDELDEDVLPASLVIITNDIADYPAIVKRFEESAFKDLVEEADYSDNQVIIGRISHTIDVAYQVGMGVSAIFVIISVIVIFNTIRMTIYSHREEVGIMKLVGATNWFIRAPFVLEGALLGLLAALTTLLIFYLILYFTDPAITSFFQGYNFSVFSFFVQNGPIVVGLEIAGAITISVVSTMIAITRYLKV